MSSDSSSVPSSADSLPVSPSAASSSASPAPTASSPQLDSLLEILFGSYSVYLRDSLSISQVDYTALAQLNRAAYTKFHSYTQSAQQYYLQKKQLHRNYESLEYQFQLIDRLNQELGQLELIAMQLDKQSKNVQLHFERLYK